MQPGTWLGVPVLKLPTDLWVYQEILHEVRPDLIVETGTFRGGSALYLASVMDLLGVGSVVSIDLEPKLGLPTHPRIRYLRGSSVSPEIVATVRGMAKDRGRVMVILDSDHHRDHVLQELKAYGPLVTKGSYLIVEDTSMNGHPVAPEYGPGPMEAVQEFLKQDPGFAVDGTREKFPLTANPRGYLKRVS